MSQLKKYLHSRLDTLSPFLKLNFLLDGEMKVICANVSIFHFSVCFKVRMEGVKLRDF